MDQSRNEGHTVSPAMDSIPEPSSTALHTATAENSNASINDSDSSNHESTLVHLLGGALAGLFSDGCVHPVDTIRARLQVQQNIPHEHVKRLASSTTYYRSATDALVKMVRFEGASSLYRGFGAVAVGTIPGHALYFAGYEYCKKRLEPMTRRSDGSYSKAREVSVHLTSGLVADVFGALVWTPMDVVKQRLQVQAHNTGVDGAKNTNYKGTADAVRTILREDGFRGLYRGFGAGLLTFGPYVAIYFALYEQFKLAMAHDRRSPFYESSGQDVKNLPFYVYLSTAALAGGISAMFTCPLDVAKTRIQVQQRGSGRTYYRNAVHALRTIVKEEGFLTLFQGLQPRILWMAGGTALTMVACKFTR